MSARSTRHDPQLILAYVILLLLGVSGPAWGQADSLAPVRLAWPLLDLLLLPDTVVGLRVLASPTPASTAGSGLTALVEMDLEPIEALQWASLLAGTAADEPLGAVTALRATPVLADPRGGKYLRLVHESQPADPTRQLYLIIADSSARRYWRLFTTATAIDTLAEAMHRTAQHSHRDTGNSREPPDDRPVELLAVPRLEYPKQLEREGRIGRVWAEYIVGASGRAEERSIRILLTDNPLFTREVYSVLQRARFRPALKDGKPVARRAQQAFQFRMAGD